MVRSNAGIGFIGGLQLLFITLKIVGIIDWDWLWILSPTIVSAFFIAILSLILIIVAVASEVYGRKKNR